MLTLLWRGLLLVYGAVVFADTLESIDEVISPRIFIVYTSDFGLNLIINY